MKQLSAAAVALTAALLAPSAHALAMTTAGSSCRITFEDQVKETPFTSEQGPSGAVHRCFQNIFGAGYSEGDAYAGYKQLQLLLAGVAIQGAAMEGRTVTSFTDTVTVYSSRLPEGTWGMATGGWYMEQGDAYGALLPGVDTGIAWLDQDFTGNIDGTYSVSGELRHSISSGVDSTYRREIETLVFPFQFGRPFVLSGTVDTRAGAREGARVWVNDRVNWRGLSFETTSGVSPGAITVVAESGTDWVRVAVVPEPSSYLLMLVGGLAVAAACRRRLPVREPQDD